MLYYGTITAVHPPGSKQNLNKYQYEYSVLITGDNFCQIPLNNVLVMDDFGSSDDYMDHVLYIGQKVCIMTFRQNFSQAIIVGAIRNSHTVTAAALGRHWKRRFNTIEEYIDKDGNWSVKSDQGENIQMNKAFITLDNSTGESIYIDKSAKTITVKAGKDWTMQLGGNLNITASGDATVKCTNVTVTASGDAKLDAGGNVDIKSGGNAKVDAGGSAEIKAGGSAKVDASSISLNGQSGQILTTVTMPVVDLITGVPSMGVPTVKAG